MPMQSTMDLFGNSVLLGVHAALQKTYTDTLKTTLIPAYEKSSEAMFKQIQDVFIQGTKACEFDKNKSFTIIYLTNTLLSDSKQFESYISQYQPMHEDIINQIQILPEKFKSINDSSVNQCANQINQQVLKDLKSLQMNLIKSLRENIKTEVK